MVGELTELEVFVLELDLAMKEGLRAEQALRVIVERRAAAIRDAKQVDDDDVHAFDVGD
jgi:hypothetical protein